MCRFDVQQVKLAVGGPVAVPGRGYRGVIGRQVSRIWSKSFAQMQGINSDL